MPIDLDKDVPEEWINSFIPTNEFTGVPKLEEDIFPTCSTEEVCEKKERVLNMSEQELTKGIEYLDKPVYTRAEVFDYVDDCQEKYNDLIKTVYKLTRIEGIWDNPKFDKVIENIYEAKRNLREALYLSDIGLDYDNKK